MTFFTPLLFSGDVYILPSRVSDPFLFKDSFKFKTDIKLYWTLSVQWMFNKKNKGYFLPLRMSTDPIMSSVIPSSIRASPVYDM